MVIAEVAHVPKLCGDGITLHNWHRNGTVIFDEFDDIPRDYHSLEILFLLFV